MRTYGVTNFPDSAVKVIAGQVVFDIPAGVKTNPKTGPALTACSKDLPQSSSSGSDSLNFHDGLKYAICMRSHGINYPDPSTRQGSTPTGNPDAPAFRAASIACRKKVYGNSSR
jgi:hypothetical protein